MAKMLNISINVNKINKARLIQGEKGTYLNLTVAVNDDKDQYGNDVSAWEGQTQEEREAKEARNFLGNGKVFWSNDQRPAPPKQEPPAYGQGEPDDIPF